MQFQFFINNSNRPRPVPMPGWKKGVIYAWLSGVGIFLLLHFSGCGIPQWQREMLSDPILEKQELIPGTSDGMLPYREGSSGAENEGSGGCGC